MQATAGRLRRQPGLSSLPTKIREDHAVRRRTMLAGTGAVLAASGLPCPSVAQAAGARTLVFVPQGGLASLDPV